MPAIRLDHRPDGVVVLTFDQPGRSANVLTPELWAEFDAALASVETDSSVRGLVLASAKPGVFIAGADLKFFLNLPDPNAPECRAYMEQGLRVLERLERLPFPTCAAIDGAALGGGLEVALACDFRIGNTHDAVQLRLPETQLGLIPGWGGTQRLPRMIGMEATAVALRTGADVRDAMDDDLDLVETEAGGDYLLNCSVAHVLNGWPKVRSIRDAKRCDIPAWNRYDVSPSATDSEAVRAAMEVLAAGAELPLADAIKLETDAFVRLAGSDESKRLIAEFFAARRKPAPPESPPLAEG